jgi:hypothetical protein
MMVKRFWIDDRGSMPMALLVITIALSMSAMLMPVVVRQIKTTEAAVDRNVQINAARAGLDSMMAQVRAAARGSEGELTDLPPCKISGNAGVNAAGESLTWTVETTYYKIDENGKNIKLGCPEVKGAKGLNEVPTIATLTSVGANAQGQRSLSATYVFSTSNINIPGGSIRIDTNSQGKQCFDAGSRSPAQGSRLMMKACDSSSGQQFAYTPELFLKVINSEAAGTDHDNGMCIDPGTVRGGNNSIYITFSPCPDPDAINATKCAKTKNCKYQFQWALDGSSRFKSTDITKQTEEAYCMTMESPNTKGSAVLLSTKTCGSGADSVIWRSDPSVGAGMAGDATNQLVNYAQFSRCLDVTSKVVTSTYMIAWFCKQAPDKNIDWNQMWYHTAPQAPATSATDIITINLDKNNNNRYCLRSPLNPASNVYTTVVSCPKGSDTSAKDLQWTIYHDTGSYASSYRIVDSAGYCLTPTDLKATPKDTHSDGTSKVKVAVCSGSELQKWNAPANLSQPTPLTNLREN